VVSFTPRPLYPRGKKSRYPFDRKLSGPQSRSGHGEVKILAPTRTRTRTIRAPSPWLVAIPIALSRLSFHNYDTLINEGAIYTESGDFWSALSLRLGHNFESSGKTGSSVLTTIMSREIDRLLAPLRGMCLLFFVSCLL
jgi:hypothetical protein